MQHHHQNLKTSPPIANPTEARIFVYRPTMFAWVGRKKNGPITYYSHELRNTLSQIVNKKILPHIDFDYGYQSLIHLIEETLKGQYNDARIYINKHPGHEFKSHLLRHYKKGVLQEGFMDPNFSSDKSVEVKDEIIRRLISISETATEVYHISDRTRNVKNPNGHIITTPRKR